MSFRLILIWFFIVAAVGGTAMEGFGLRKTQSLWSLSEVQDRSWVMPDHTRWDRKSVFELVQQ